MYTVLDNLHSGC